RLLSTPSPYTTLVRSREQVPAESVDQQHARAGGLGQLERAGETRDAQRREHRRGHLAQVWLHAVSVAHDSPTGPDARGGDRSVRSEEHTSELQSREKL